MILDDDLMLSEAQAITADAYSTNVIDLGAAGMQGKPLWLVCRVHTTFDSAGEAATLQIVVRTAAAVDSTPDLTSAVDLVASKVITEAELVANTEIFKVRLPLGLLRYLQVYYDRGTEDFTAGKMDCFIVPDVEVRP